MTAHRNTQYARVAGRGWSALVFSVAAFAPRSVEPVSIHPHQKPMHHEQHPNVMAKHSESAATVRAHAED